MIRLSEKQKELILELDKNGYSGRATGRMLGIPKSTVNDFLSKEKLKPKEVYSGAKILVYDVENTPEINYTWGRFKQFVSEEMVIQRPYLLTWSAKWVGEDEILKDTLINYPDELKRDPTNDRPIVESLWNLMDEADVVIAHNNDRHDEPLLNTRAMIHGLNPPAPYKRIDTLKEVKRTFKFPSNSLKSLLAHLDLTRKIENEGFELWRKCMAGDPEAFATMLDYNVGDVVSLEELYLKIRPWIRNHPNISLYGDNESRQCVVCSSDDLEYMPGKLAFTGVSAFPTHRCNNCGKVNRERVTIKNVAERKKILTNAL